MIFMTIGTLHPFDRLVQMVDELAGEGKLPEPTVAQIGYGSYQPKHLEAYDILDKNKFDSYMDQASLIISHAGMGSIITAITLKKKMIIVPRMRKYREHVNDHQLHSAQKFEEIGAVQYADNKAQLLEKIKQIDSFEPAERPEYIAPMISKISDFLNTVTPKNNDS